MYKNYAKRVLRDAILLLLLIGIIDFCIGLNQQIYGLGISAYSAIFMVYPSLNGRYVIAALNDPDNIENKISLDAERTVMTNISFVLLTFGFILQMIAVQI